MGQPSVASGHVALVTDSRCDLSPERPLHFAEKVLPILHGLGTDSYLVVKKHQSMEAMLLYLGRCGPPHRAGQAGGVPPSGAGTGDLVTLGRSSSGRGHQVGRPLPRVEQCPGTPPWVSVRGQGWCSLCPPLSSPSQPRGRDQARHDEVPRGPQPPGPGPALRRLPRSLLHPQQQLPAALQGGPGT